MVEDQIVLPYPEQGLLGERDENTRVLSEDYDTTGRIMKVRVCPAPSRAPEQPSPLREFALWAKVEQRGLIHSQVALWISSATFAATRDARRGSVLSGCSRRRVVMCCPSIAVWRE